MEQWSILRQKPAPVRCQTAWRTLESAVGRLYGAGFWSLFSDSSVIAHVSIRRRHNVLSKGILM